MPGKPFTKVDEAQRAAFGQQLKRGLLDLGKHLGGEAVTYLGDHPENPVTQTLVATERDTGAVTVIVRGVSALLRERELKAAAEARAKAGPQVVDAEFVEDKA